MYHSNLYLNKSSPAGDPQSRLFLVHHDAAGLPACNLNSIQSWVLDWCRVANGNRISKLITAVYKVNRQDKTSWVVELPGLPTLWDPTPAFQMKTSPTD